MCEVKCTDEVADNEDFLRSVFCFIYGIVTKICIYCHAVGYIYQQPSVQKQEVDNCLPICYFVGIQMST